MNSQCLLLCKWSCTIHDTWSKWLRMLTNANVVWKGLFTKQSSHQLMTVGLELCVIVDLFGKVFNCVCMQHLFSWLSADRCSVGLTVVRDYICQDGGLFAEHWRVRLGGTRMAAGVPCWLPLPLVWFEIELLKKMKKAQSVSTLSMCCAHPAEMPITAIHIS